MCRKEKNSLSNLYPGRKLLSLSHTHEHRGRQSQEPSCTPFTCSYDQGKAASHISREAVALIPAPIWSFKGKNVYAKYHWYLTLFATYSLALEIKTLKGLVTEGTATFSYSIFYRIKIFNSYRVSHYFQPPHFSWISYFTFLLCFAKLNWKPINEAFSSSSLMPAF